jgi:hypothetical protein
MHLGKRTHPCLLLCTTMANPTEWAVEEMRRDRNGFPTVESLMNYRGQGEDELFELWCDSFFRPAYGSAAFREKTKKKPLSSIMTVFDEAFVVATIDNNYERWMKEAELLSQGLPVDKKKLPRQKYTNDAAASKKYQGWSKEGIDFFNKNVNDLNQVRNTSTSKTLENTYMENVNMDLQSKKNKKGTSVPETQAVDGLQAYLKNFFPNLIDTGEKRPITDQDETYQADADLRNKRPRVSLENEKGIHSGDDDYVSDVDDNYRTYNSGDIGQIGGV